MTEQVLKFVVIGDSGTGKSSLLVRFIDNSFDQDQGPTIGVDFKSKVVTVDGKKVKLTIWDTAGQERFRTLTASYYRGAHGVILVYDVTSRESFDHVQDWLSELDIYATNPNLVKMLIGNKIDLPNRKVPFDEGVACARRHNMKFEECSAKNSSQVQTAFEELTRSVLEHPTLTAGVKGVALGGSAAGGAYYSSCANC